MKIIYFIIFNMIFLAVNAQKITISGYITDKVTGEKLIYASVYDCISKQGTVTNASGFYSLSLEKNDSVGLIVSYIGYKAQEMNLLVDASTEINFEMQQSVQLNEIVINAKKNSVNATQIGTIEVPLQKIREMPTITGETDIMKVLQLMPGIQSGAEGSSDIYVRGGSPDQNLFLLDGVPLYYVSHVGGYFSVFDVDAINNMMVYKGGFPARYGGKLSSIVSLTLKDGTKKKLTGEGKINIFASKFFIEGPIYKDKTTFMLSVRRSNLDLYTRAISHMIDKNFSFGYTFYDINGKVTHRFSDDNRLSVSFYTGRDRIFSKIKNFSQSLNTDSSFVNYTTNSMWNNRWGNKLGAVSWGKNWGGKLFSETKAYFTQFYFETMMEFEKKSDTTTTPVINEKSTYESMVSDIAFKTDFDYYPNNKHHIRFGGDFIWHTFRPGISKYKSRHELIEKDTTYGNSDIYTKEQNFYIEDEINITNKLKTNIGVHQTLYRTESKNYFSVEPRLLLNYCFTEKLSVKMAYSKMTQSVHLLSNEGLGVPTDLWMPSTVKVKPEYSDQFTAGVFYYIDHWGMDASIEAYYKTMKNLINIKEGVTFDMMNSGWQNNIETDGQGIAKGIEFLIQKKQGKTTGWISYTLSKNDRKFSAINNGVYFPYKYDKRHNISIVINRQLTDRISFSATWVFTSGDMTTMPNSKYSLATINYEEGKYPKEIDFPFHHIYYETTFPSEEELYATKYQTAYYYDSQNNYRLPSYHRLDISFLFRKQKKYGLRTWQIGLYNVYNRHNIYYLYYQTNDLYKFCLLPIIPSVGYSYKF